MSHEVLVKTSRGRRSIIVDDALCESMGVSHSNIEGVSLFVASWLALLSDSPLNSTTIKPLRAYHDFVRDMYSVGLKKLVVKYSDLSHQIVSSIHMMGESSSTGEFVEGMKDTCIFHEYLYFYRTGDIHVLKFIYTFLNFGKKLEYEDDEFNTTAFRSWMDIENRLAGQSYDEEDLLSLRKILSTVLPTFSWTNAYPKFGPGAVQERGVKGRIGKLEALSYDPLIDRFLLHGHIGKYGCGQELGVSHDQILPPGRWDPDRGVSSRIARLLFVPKNLKTSRSICMEPNTLMYFQQAVMREFLDLIDRSPLSRFIDIKDQKRNQDLAHIGSYTGEVDTIDLSAASDSVSLELVKSIFPRSWLIPMISTRSHSAILPNGDIHPLKKFAPMGSALCFPTQCIIFASVCIYAACRDAYQKSHSTQPWFVFLSEARIRKVIASFKDTVVYTSPTSPLRFQPLAVYGDDICVDRRLTQDVTSILGRLGFSVNIEKSFTGSQSFRESCGKFFLNGHDITPLYYRVKGVKRSLSSSHIMSGVNLVNRAWEYRYDNLYRFFRNSLSKWYVRKSLRGISSMNPIPFVPAGSKDFGFFTKSPKNTHLAVRYNSDYQRDEVRCWHISYVSKTGGDNSLIDFYEHMRWWGSRVEGTSTEEFSASAPRFDTSGAGVVWRWMPHTE